MPHHDVLSAVIEPRRRAILQVLAAEPLPVGRLAERFDVSRPAISQHLAVLRAAGLVEATAERGRSTYRIRAGGVAAARRALARLAGELPGDAAAGEAQAPAGPQPAPDIALALLAPAPRERLFALFTTAEGLGRWLGPAQVDLRPGGRYRVDLGGDAACGTYSVVEAPARLVFGWGQDGGSLEPDASSVEIRLEPAGGGTLVRLEQRGLPDEARAPHLGSWAMHLPRLVASAGRRA